MSYNDKDVLEINIKYLHDHDFGGASITGKYITVYYYGNNFPERFKSNCVTPIKLVQVYKNDAL